MKITIEIDCETISDFYSHLSELRRQIKKECKRLKLVPSNDEFPPTVDLDDDNCYGTHTVTISEDFLSEKVEGFRARNIIGESKSLLNSDKNDEPSVATGDPHCGERRYQNQSSIKEGE